jgi:putative glutamine amidotransferase
VAVTGRRLAAGRVERWPEAAVGSPARYLESVGRAGGLPAVLLPVAIDAALAAVTIDRFDGLVLTGGIDVDPAAYGAHRQPQTYGCDPVTDGYEIALLRAAIAADRPVLAICRGMQILNVAFGGTLHQHITGQPGLASHGVPNGGGGAPVAVTAEPGSRLAAALGTDRATGMCHHHQAVDRVGAGLLVVASADDGLIEGLELDAASWVVGVQWHPEDTTRQDPVQQRLFSAFVAECARRPTPVGQPRGR